MIYLKCNTTNFNSALQYFFGARKRNVVLNIEWKPQPNDLSTASIRKLFLYFSKLHTLRYSWLLLLYHLYGIIILVAPQKIFYNAYFIDQTL